MPRQPGDSQPCRTTHASTVRFVDEQADSVPALPYVLVLSALYMDRRNSRHLIERP